MFGGGCACGMWNEVFGVAGVAGVIVLLSLGDGEFVMVVMDGWVDGWIVWEKHLFLHRYPVSA